MTVLDVMDSFATRTVRDLAQMGSPSRRTDSHCRYSAGGSVHDRSSSVWNWAIMHAALDLEEALELLRG